MVIPSSRLSIGFSPCPNDTFIFNGLVHDRLISGGLEFSDEILADVETLNNWALEERLDVTKISFHALGHVLDKYVLLNTGSALGRGCGPLLVTVGRVDPANIHGLKIAIPGKLTTAAMLLRLFRPDCRNLVDMRFDQIMPAILAGEVDAGVIIHESRFTYKMMGLDLVEDLGGWWEKISGHPIPLGCIVARRSLGMETIRRIDQAVRESLRQAFAKPELCMSYVKKYAQELDEKVMSDHISLYVNSYSENLEQEGVAAVCDFLTRGRQAGILPEIGELTMAS
ncbi:MAG: 1,4-dihydroxy-6-naphthoate synthase [Proteobacteria bacterium]|nr:1,4-dihydroxy-6-naphthoate synthase [Pseudomonadota bacterium]MBU1715198.1 1,4-dihydroxy-6-naphthoate synthase [Pseudomonadota bacterium]